MEEQVLKCGWTPKMRAGKAKSNVQFDGEGVFTCRLDMEKKGYTIKVHPVEAAGINPEQRPEYWHQASTRDGGVVVAEGRVIDTFSAYPEAESHRLTI